MNCPTVRIKPSHPSQGDHVVINAADFDPKVHTLLDPGPPPAGVPAPVRHAPPAPPEMTPPPAPVA